MKYILKENFDRMHYILADYSINRNDFFMNKFNLEYKEDVNGDSYTYRIFDVRAGSYYLFYTNELYSSTDMIIIG